MVKNENRMRFHSDVSYEVSGHNTAFFEFRKFVESLLPKDKLAIFLQLMKFPIDTVRLTDETYQALKKVFDGRDPVFQYEFLSEETKENWMQYREEELKASSFWKTQGFEAMKLSIHSVMVVDMPTEQTTTNPEPYMYFLDVRNIIDYEEHDDQIEWIIFEMPGDRIGVYDDGFYRVFTKENWQNDAATLTPIIESTHDLGYCPAKFFWSGLSPIATQMAQLDWILFFSVSKKYSDLYSPYTIYWGFQQDCEFEDKESGYHCDGGYLVDRDDRHLYTANRQLMSCPKCSDRINGVGSFVEVPAPTDKDDPMLTPPVGKIDVDVQSLDYNVKELKRIEENFYSAVTGNSLESINDQAVNEKQVMSLFESRKAALVNLKGFFEDAQSWSESTICRLRYGNSFVSLNIDYGTEFYLFTPEVILDMYVKAREANMDHMTLDMLQREAYETKYRNNPIEKARTNIILNIDPFRHLQPSKVTAMYEANQVSYEDYMTKINMSSLIMRFERENGSIIEFGNMLSFDEKIKRIKEALAMYVGETPEPKPEPEPQV